MANTPTEQGPLRVPGGGSLVVVGLLVGAGHIVGMEKKGSSGFRRGGGFAVNAGSGGHMVGMKKPVSDIRGYTTVARHPLTGAKPIGGQAQRTYIGAARGQIAKAAYISGRRSAEPVGGQTHTGVNE